MLSHYLDTVFCQHAYVSCEQCVTDLSGVVENVFLELRVLPHFARVVIKAVLLAQELVYVLIRLKPYPCTTSAHKTTHLYNLIRLLILWKAYSYLSVDDERVFFLYLFVDKEGVFVVPVC